MTSDHSSDGEPSHPGEGRDVTERVGAKTNDGGQVTRQQGRDVTGGLGGHVGDGGQVESEGGRDMAAGRVGGGIRHVDKPGEIETVEELLVYAYDQEGKRFSIPAAVFEVVDRRQEVVSDRLRELVRQSGATDRLLAVPPRLLVAVEAGEVTSRLKRLLLDLIAIGLRSHPLFTSHEVDAVLAGEPPQDVHRSFEALRAAVAAVTTNQHGLLGDEIKKTDRHRLRANAVTALALYLAMRDRWDTSALVACLNTHLWEEESRLARGGSRKSMLADNRSPEVLGIVADVYARQVRDLERREGEALTEVGRARERLDETVEELDAARYEMERRDHLLEQHRVELDELRNALESEQRHRVADRSHHADDYEQLRTRTLRMLERQIKLLEDGLHALQNDRTRVAEEFIERAIEAFRSETARLRDEEP